MPLDLTWLVDNVRFSKSRLREVLQEISDFIDTPVEPDEPDEPGVTDHGDLTGLGDDDHTQYVLANGARAFTDKVSGVSPTIDAHLATKLYVDTSDEALDAAITALLPAILPAGGLTSQVLAKASNGDYDVQWITGGGGGATDHGALTGLSDDDHPQYVLADGTRAFTAPVTGVTPTLDNHLATKVYTDNLIATGIITPLDDDLDLSGGLTDYVLTKLSDGSVAFAAPTEGVTEAERAALTTILTDPEAHAILSWDNSLDEIVWLTTLPISLGGTGGSTQATARASLDVYSTSEAQPRVWDADVAAGGFVLSGLGIAAVAETGTTHTWVAAEREKIVVCSNIAGCTITLPDSASPGNYLVRTKSDGPVVIAMSANVIIDGVAGNTVSPTLRPASTDGAEDGGWIWIKVWSNAGAAPICTTVNGDLAGGSLDLSNTDLLNVGAGTTFETPSVTLAALGGLPLAGGTLGGSVDADDNDLLNIGAGSTFETPATTLAALGGLPSAGGAVSGNLVGNGSVEAHGFISAFITATGSEAAAVSGRSAKITGNVTAVPITNGWWRKYLNVSGSNKTITPASGTCVKTALGTTGASVTLANNKSCFVQGDGTNLIVDGDVT